MQNHPSARLTTICAVAMLCILGAGLVACTAQRRGGPSGQRLPPFSVRKIAWRALLDDHPEVGPPKQGLKRRAGLDKALKAFYDTLRRPATEKRARKKQCSRAWRKLSKQASPGREHHQELTLAKAYLAAECGYSQKMIPPLRRLTKRFKQIDSLYYSAQFWFAETYLERGKTKAAISRYRFVLGEIDSPLYPLALYRTAHCYWEAEDIEKAREFLQHSLDWIGNKNTPVWIRSFKQQAARELGNLSDP